MIRTELDANKINCEALVAEFQTGKVSLLLISLRTGGEELNLAGADFVIHMDTWWDSAFDRAYRIGQLRMVTAKKYAFAWIKKDLDDYLLEGSDLSGKLTHEELSGLLRK